VSTSSCLGSMPVSRGVPASAFTMAPMLGWLVRPLMLSMQQSMMSAPASAAAIWVATAVPGEQAQHQQHDEHRNVFLRSCFTGQCLHLAGCLPTPTCAARAASLPTSRNSKFFKTQSAFVNPACLCLHFGNTPITQPQTPNSQALHPHPHLHCRVCAGE
jgi:hypothetical protein